MDLKNCGVVDVFIACMDDLKGFPEAIDASHLKTTMHSLNYMNWKLRKLAANLKTI
jgi:transposase-like protein